MYMIKSNQILDERDKRLRKKSIDVTFPLEDKYKKFIDESIEMLTLSQIEEEAEKYNLRPGMGLSAVQVGILKRIFVIVYEYEEGKFENYIFINPKILSHSEEMVYVTDYQGVYHTFSDCTYLSLSVTTASKSSLSSLRNVYGEKYHPCERCVRSSSNQNTFYITQSGNRYHSSSSCGGLTRHVRLIKKSELQNLHLCSRCAQRNGGH